MQGGPSPPAPLPSTGEGVRKEYSFCAFKSSPGFGGGLPSGEHYVVKVGTLRVIRHNQAGDIDINKATVV
jgi:hypothetical protein